MERGSYIQVASGGIFDPLNPDPEKIDIRDIAHALANQCRFCGHCDRHYSVAEHSVHVSRVCDPDDALHGLLHDAPEAYLGDLASPLKGTEEYSAAYLRAEFSLMGAICRRFGLHLAQPSSVSRADKAMLEIERLALFPRTAEGDELWAEWPAGDVSWVPPECRPHYWHPELAKMFFLERFAELTDGR